MQALLKFAPYVAMLVILIGTHAWTYRHGIEHQKGLQAKSDNQALIKSTTAIAETFKQYERILSEIQPDENDAPASLVSTVNLLPDPKSKKK